ncbi:hypothetical protein CIB48_g3200 [Xylaria polymorpha]|nr:hypothetical protein CIB48_g3200 [Xylaria polymorpha]
MIIGMKYRDITMAAVRDPVDRNKRRLVATFTLWRNKLRWNALEHKKGENIHSGAFKAGYKSVEELLHRPNLEDVDYVPLEWNDNMAEEDIFPMSYTTFSCISH